MGVVVFPTGYGMVFRCAASPGHREYIICNADEGDPGAFMDRSVVRVTRTVLSKE